MTDYKKLAYMIPVVNDFKPLIELTASTIRSVSSSTDLLADAFSIVAPILKIIDPPLVKLGEKARKAVESVVEDYENTEFSVFHFHPSAVYNIFDYTTFLDILDDTLQNEENIVTPTTRAIVWIVSADNQEDLVSSVDALRTLFGQPIFKTPPDKEIRNKYKDFRSKLSKVTATKLMPTVKSLTGAMNQSKGLLQDAQGFSGMVDTMITTLKKKADQYATVAAQLEAAILALDLLDSIEIDRVVLSGFTTNTDISDQLRLIESSPKPTDLVACSLFLYDSDVAVFIEGLL